MAVTDIQAADLREMLRVKRDQIEIIDVREEDEYQSIHIKGSKLIPMGQLLGKVSEIDWNKEVVFICRSGSRSKMMASLLGAREKTSKIYATGYMSAKLTEKESFLKFLEMQKAISGVC